MDREEVRNAFNTFLKMYKGASEEVYEEINFRKIKGKRFKYLKVIGQKNEVTLTELAEHFNLSKPTVNEVIDQFEINGFVAKRKSETDKRVSYIYLTDIGRILATTNELESKKAVDKMYEKLTNKELKTLTKIFNKFGADGK
ncbi:MarR family winged helix-turn-helix transcriptional regulator [Candidatus Izimaplasma bacterium]|nr:MarR family winged helix-turn-helix transcriptional regulator [Candidatus Izimaplasma bacterium]